MQATYDPDLDDDVESSGKVWLKRIAIALMVLLILGSIGYGIKSLMSGSGGPQKKQKTTIKLLPDTPPPPPPPPPKEPPKELPKPDAPKEIKVEQPKPAEAPPAEVLKMEGTAGDGPSPFAAGEVSNEYKGGEIGSETGTKIGGAPNKQQFTWYTSLIKEQIEDAMAKDKALANGAYKLVVKVWVSSNGKIQRHELVGSSGNTEVDVLISKALDDMPALSEGPPGDMPQPIKLRVTARSVG